MVRVRVDKRVMAMKMNSTLPRAPELEPHHQQDPYSSQQGMQLSSFKCRQQCFISKANNLYMIIFLSNNFLPDLFES